MVVTGQYDGGSGPLDSSFSLLQMPCQSQVFYFGNSEIVCFIYQSTTFSSLHLSTGSYLISYYY